MTIQARNKIIEGKLLELYNSGKRLKEEQTLSQQYKNWLEGEQTISQQYKNWLKDVLNFINKEVDEDTEEEFSLRNICFQSNCGNIYDLEEFAEESIKQETTEYYENMLNIIKFYIPVFSGKPFKDVDSNESFEESKNMIKTKKLFISHSSKDKEVQDQFIMLLENGIGLDEDQYFYQSGDGTGVKISEDINTRIRGELNNNECLFIALFSKNYFKSIPCLMELGACWRMNDNIVGIVIDPQKETFEKSKEAVCGKLLLNYDTLLSSSTRIDELKDLILKHLGVQQNKDNKHLMRYRDKLVATVRSMTEEQDE